MNMEKPMKMAVLGVCVIAGAAVAAPGPGMPNGHGAQPVRHVQPAKGPSHHAKPAPAHHHAKPAPHHHHHPAGARHWARPACPPPRHGARRAWGWVEAAWNMTVNGVYYYGDGYYFDGYNYFYNGAYYTTPPVMVSQPAPVVVSQPAPVVVTQPAPPPPPPPPRRRGLLNVLFGD